MQVRDLVAALLKLPQRAEVLINDAAEEWTVVAGVSSYTGEEVEDLYHDEINSGPVVVLDCGELYEDSGKVM